MILESIGMWAQSLGTTEDTLKTRLANRGIVFQKGMKFGAKEIFNSMTTDKGEAQARKAVAEAEAKEMENDQTRAILMRKPDVEKIIWDELMLPLRQGLSNMPGAIAAQCNPDKPEMAFGVIQSYVEGIKSNIIQECAPKIETTPEI